METAALIASVVSFIIGCFAIWLSITFYKMSKEESAKTIEAAKDISSGVARLDDLFNRLYADTFGMMRDTVSDMQKHFWNDTRSEARDYNREIDDLKKKVREEILSEFKIEIKKLIEKEQIEKDRSQALEKGLSKKASTFLEQAQERIEKVLNERSRGAILSNIGPEGNLAQLLFVDFTGKYGFSSRHFFDQMKLMRSEGLIAWEGRSLNPESIVRLCDRQTTE